MTTPSEAVIEQEREKKLYGRSRRIEPGFIDTRKDWGKDLKHHAPIVKPSVAKTVKKAAAPKAKPKASKGDASFAAARSGTFKMRDLKPGDKVKDGNFNYTVHHVDTRVGNNGTMTLKTDDPDEDKKAGMGADPDYEVQVVGHDAKVAAAAAKVKQKTFDDLAQGDKDKYAVGKWSEAFRHHDGGKMSDDFEAELHQSEAGRKGEGQTDEAKAADHILNHVAKSAPLKGELHRGVHLAPGDIRKMKAGSDLDLPVSSFSKSWQQAEGFAAGKDDPKEKGAVIHVAKGAKGWDITKLSHYSEEQEVISGGRFHVDSVSKDANGTTHIYTHQAALAARSEASDVLAHALRSQHAAWQKHIHPHTRIEPGVLDLRDWHTWDMEHPWAKKGRSHKFAEQDKAVVKQAHEEASHMPAGKGHTDLSSDADYAEHRDHVEHELVSHGTNDLMRSPFSTHNSEDRVNGVEGAYTAERLALHDRIISEYMERAAAVPRDHKAIITAGLGGAGKSTVLRHEAESPDSVAGKLGIKYDHYDKHGHGVGDPNNFVTINPDDIKERLAQLGAIPKIDALSPMEASPFAHEEASQLTERIATRLQSTGTNVIHDTTLNSEKSGLKRLKSLRSAPGGYHVSGVMVDVSTAQSLANAEKRHRGGQERFAKGIGQGGRYVPSDLIKGAGDPSGQFRSVNRAAFEGLKASGAFDHTLTIDNEGFAGKVLDESSSLNHVKQQMKEAQLERVRLHNARKLAGVRSDGTSDITDHIVAYRKGEMNFQNLVNNLTNREYQTPSYLMEKHGMDASEWADRSEPGTWGEVQHANDTGLLTDDEYHAIHAAVTSQDGQRIEQGWVRADPQHDPRSTMVSLDLPAGTIDPVPGGLPGDEHHITIVYAGKIDQDAFKQLLDAARDVAAKTGPLAGMVGGIGSFPPSEGSDGLTPYYAIPSIPGIEKLHEPLAQFSGSEHTEYHPHVTLTYGEEGEAPPPPVPPTPVVFTHLAVHRGGKPVAKFPLTGIRVEQSCVWVVFDDEQTRDWAKWHLEHPYIHHPRPKHPGHETEHHAHRPTSVVQSSVEAKEIPEIPRIPKAEKTEKAAQIEAFRKEAQEISKGQYKVGSSRGQHFEEGYITARLHAQRVGMEPTAAHALAAEHMDVTTGLQANQARAKREGVAAGYRAHGNGTPEGYDKNSTMDFARAKSLPVGTKVRGMYQGHAISGTVTEIRDHSVNANKVMVRVKLDHALEGDDIVSRKPGDIVEVENDERGHYLEKVPGEPPAPAPPPPAPGGNPYPEGSPEAAKWQRAHDFAIEFATAKGYTAEQTAETIERTRLAQVGGPGAASHLTSNEGKEGLLAGYKKYAETAPSAPAPTPGTAEGPGEAPESRYMKGSPKYKAFVSGHSIAIASASAQGMTAADARDRARQSGNVVAANGPSVRRAEAEGKEAGFKAYADAIDRGWSPSGETPTPAPTPTPEPDTHTMTKPVKDLLPGDQIMWGAMHVTVSRPFQVGQTSLFLKNDDGTEHAARVGREGTTNAVVLLPGHPKYVEPKAPEGERPGGTGSQRFNPEIHEKVYARDIRPGDWVAAYGDGNLFPPSDRLKPFGQSTAPTFEKVTSVTVGHGRERNDIKTEGPSKDGLGGGANTLYIRLKSASEPQRPVIVPGGTPAPAKVAPPVVAPSGPSTTPRKNLTGVPPIPEVDQPLPDSRPLLVAPQVTRATGEVREKGPKTNPVIGHIEKDYGRYRAVWYAPDGSKNDLGATRTQKAAVEKLKEYHNGILNGTVAPPARIRDISDPPPGGFRKDDQVFYKGDIVRVQATYPDGDIGIRRAYGDPVEKVTPGAGPALAPTGVNPFDPADPQHAAFERGYHRGRYDAHQNRLDSQRVEYAIRVAERDSSRDITPVAEAELRGRIAGLEQYSKDKDPITASDLEAGNVVGKTANGSDVRVASVEKFEHPAPGSAKVKLHLFSTEHGATFHTLGPGQPITGLAGAHALEARTNPNERPTLPDDIPDEHVERFSEGYKEGLASGMLSLRRGQSLEAIEQGANEREARGMNGSSGAAYLSESKGFAAGQRQAIENWSRMGPESLVPDHLDTEASAEAYRQAKQTGFDDAGRMVAEGKDSDELKSIAAVVYSHTKNLAKGSEAQAKMLGRAHGLYIAAEKVAPQREKTLVPLKSFRNQHEYRYGYDMAAPDVAKMSDADVKASMARLTQRYVEGGERLYGDDNRKRKALLAGQIAAHIDKLNADDRERPGIAPEKPLTPEEMGQARSDVLHMLMDRDGGGAERFMNNALAGAMQYEKVARANGLKTPGDVTLHDMTEVGDLDASSTDWTGRVLAALKGAKTEEAFTRKAPDVSEGATGWDGDRIKRAHEKLMNRVVLELRKNVTRSERQDDAAKANDWLDAMVEHVAKGAPVPEAPQLSMSYKKQEDNFDHFSPEHTAQTMARLRTINDNVEEGTAPGLRGLTAEDFARHTRIMKAGAEMRERIDSRKDVTAARKASETAAAAVPKSWHDLSKDEMDDVARLDRANRPEENPDADTIIAARKYGADQHDLRTEALRAEVHYGDVLTAATREELGKVRDMSGGADTHPLVGSPEGLKTGRKALAEYPTDWIESSACATEGGAMVGIKPKPRSSSILGQYDDDDNGYDSTDYKRKYGVTGRLSTVAASPDNYSTMVHEWGHRMEYTVPGINRLEAAHLITRQGNETGNTALGGYGSNTRGIVDQFIDTYSGRIYSQSDLNRAHELLTTGVQAVLGGDAGEQYSRHGALVGIRNHKADTRHRDFILGMLASHQVMNPRSAA